MGDEDHNDIFQMNSTYQYKCYERSGGKMVAHEKWRTALVLLLRMKDLWIPGDELVLIDQQSSNKVKSKRGIIMQEAAGNDSYTNLQWNLRTVHYVFGPCWSLCHHRYF